MKVFLNGNEINSEILTVNDGLNYGRFFDDETTVYGAYEVVLSSFELQQLIEQEYNEVRDEIKIDDELYNDVSDFTNTNYCSLSELLAHPIDFKNIMNPYLTMALYTKIFKDSPQNKFVINSTEAIIINENNIIFKGRVFKRLKG
ncbi:hypothetical protein [Polaribacter sp.]|uniref:hypothetical protein n=1 Tax=Polaribacter sp. TaxID=1920175 RepID=UPI003EF9B4A1